MRSPRRPRANLRAEDGEWRVASIGEWAVWGEDGIAEACVMGNLACSVIHGKMGREPKAVKAEPEPWRGWYLAGTMQKPRPWMGL